MNSFTQGDVSLSMLRSSGLIHTRLCTSSPSSAMHLTPERHKCEVDWTNEKIEGQDRDSVHFRWIYRKKGRGEAEQRRSEYDSSLNWVEIDCVSNREENVFSLRRGKRSKGQRRGRRVTEKSKRVLTEQNKSTQTWSPVYKFKHAHTHTHTSVTLQPSSAKKTWPPNSI